MVGFYIIRKKVIRIITTNLLATLNGPIFKIPSTYYFINSKLEMFMNNALQISEQQYPEHLSEDLTENNQVLHCI